ncbi:two-component sensor histidine kinase [Chromatium okenii]|uniref:ATP-binding protein n=1 Tax=Chromatium okenii TaxID=61644 RepID=UPI001908729D|nr:ATP-binding protein [Chromatium okenii]MBK1641473.1 two-component sensor histidine kinase [Chromatium okenii]
MNSIRYRLLFSLFVVQAIVWIAVGLVALDRAQHEVDELLDAQLAQTAHVLHQITQTGHLPDIAGTPQTLSPIGHAYESKISFQLWRGEVLVSSFGAAPAEPLAHGLGFSDQQLADTRWRVFGLPTARAGEVLYVAQNDSIRQELIEYLTFQALQPILWSLPLTALLIWLAVSDGLRPLMRLTRDITHRSAAQLTPIDLRRAPLEIRPLTTALNGLMARLEQALAAERHFAADASHELRTPFAIIRTYAQIARRSTDAEERNDALAKLIRGVDRATHLIAQLLMLARLQHQTGAAAAGSWSLIATARQVVADKQEYADSKAIALSLHLPDGDPCCVGVAPAALTVLLGNLLDNALKFTPAGGRVTVAVQARRERVVLRVEDSGRGIAPGDQMRVFDRFYRPAGQTEAGAGLGLAIVQRICELHDAEIELLDAAPKPGLLVEVNFRKAARES